MTDFLILVRLATHHIVPFRAAIPRNFQVAGLIDPTVPHWQSRQQGIKDMPRLGDPDADLLDRVLWELGYLCCIYQSQNYISLGSPASWYATLAGTRSIRHMHDDEVEEDFVVVSPSRPPFAAESPSLHDPKKP
uniref:Uncharacterized protein n=1 Tax=Oryza nivara TaxID=4536 RepID=A0A0E0HHH5_ORYNI